MAKHRPDNRSEQPARKFVAKAKLDLAGIFRQGFETPNPFKLVERTIDQFQAHGCRTLLIVLCRKMCLGAQIVDVQRRYGSASIAVNDIGTCTPRQEIRIGLNVFNKIKHPLRGMSDQDRAFNRNHVPPCPANHVKLHFSIDSHPNRIDRKCLMSIIANKKAFHDYFIEERFEAGIALTGWEVKAIRAGRANIKESYVVVRNGELFIFGMHITPLAEASTHVKPDPLRTRKLLLHASQINRLIGKVERAGYALIPLDLHFLKGRIKAEIGLAKGKKQHDKREAEKTRDWEREKARLMRVN